MCKNAEKTAASVMQAIEPELKGLLTILGQSTTPEGIAAISAYDAAIAALDNWVPGSAPEVAIEAVNAFESVFQALPIPEDAKALAALIAGGVDAVLGIIKANSPAPAPAPAVGVEEPAPITPEVAEAHQAFHAHAVAASTEASVEASTGITVSAIDKARVAVGDTSVIPKKWKKEWNAAVDASDPKYASLKAA